MENRVMVWLDMEMTGLDLDGGDTILEVAIVLTNSDLVEFPRDSQYHAIVHQTDAVLAGMNEWCIKHHGDSGLTARVRTSTLCISQVEDQIMDFLRADNRVPQGAGLLCGNSVHADRRFLARFMPKVDKYLHYRIVDVSTVKELCRAWNPAIFSKAPKKKLCHRAIDDILESIEELRFYRRHFLITAELEN
eukprot:Partr_v1_DN26686_c1_g1_i4_m69320 putative REX2, RNA exonuclease 2 homolog (S. cerevisiae)